MQYTVMAAAVLIGTSLGSKALAQSARDIRGASPLVAIENEPAARLIVDQPIPEALAAAGVAALAKSLPPETKVNIVRAFQDGDFAFAHVEYEFFGPKIGFDIFRIEDDLIVEHWDNLQEAASGPGPSGHTMTDGPTTVTDLERTEANKALMRRYMDDLLSGRRETEAPTSSTIPGLPTPFLACSPA
jgi:Family of unknown function (DUF6130)